MATVKVGDKYDYSLVEYINAHTDVTIICRKHGPFKQTPTNHLFGKNGCHQCVHAASTRTTEDFVAIAMSVHGHSYDYSKVVYKNCDEHVVIACRKHGDFSQIAWCHLAGHGCARCNMFRSWSAISMQWLKFMQVGLGDRIEHALNGGEFVFPEYRRMSADGYIESSKTVLEFHGDFFHGNPKVFDGRELHPFLGKTFGALYEKTLEREKRIQEWGYHLLVMWEHEWKRAVRAVVAIQRMWRQARQKS